MELHERIAEYNKRYLFLDNPRNFDFSFSPERLIYRNEALRLDDRELYKAYLLVNYPEVFEDEMAEFDNVAKNLLMLNNFEAMRYFKNNDIDLLKSDIFIYDDDSIVTPISTAAVRAIDNAGQVEELIGNCVRSEFVVNKRNFVWIDASSL
jgi:hypothetical protein